MGVDDNPSTLEKKWSVVFGVNWQHHLIAARASGSLKADIHALRQCDHRSMRAERGRRPEVFTEERGGRSRLYPADRVLAEPPGNPLLKNGGSIRMKSFRPRLAQRGSIDSFNNIGSNSEVDIRDFVPGKQGLQTECFGAVDS